MPSSSVPSWAPDILNSRVLVSSNRSDFAAPNATVFHPDIVPDAAAAWLLYAISLDTAVAGLRAAGEIP